MKFRFLAPFCAFFLSQLNACSDSENPAGDGDGDANGSGGASGGAASGGTTTGGSASGGASGGSTPTGGSATGGESATGGASPSGGADPGSGGGSTGGSSSGGGSGASWCPSGGSTVEPSLEGKTLTPITGVPEIPNAGGFLEGPVWHDGKLFVSQIDFQNGGSIFTYTEGGGLSLFVADVGTNGLAIGMDGMLYAASQGSKGVIAFDPGDAAVAPVDVATTYDGSPFSSPNDLVVRDDGTIYFTDPALNCQGSCRDDSLVGVYRVPPGGQAELLSTPQQTPNGIILSPDQSTLYVGGSQLTAHPVMADGSIGEGTAFGQLNQATDGLGVDCAGNLYVALHGAGQVVILDPSGTQLPGSVMVSQVTNIAFGGADNKTMFITAFGDNRGTLHSVEMEVPGLPY